MQTADRGRTGYWACLMENNGIKEDAGPPERVRVCKAGGRDHKQVSSQDLEPKYWRGAQKQGRQRING